MSVKTQHLTQTVPVEEGQKLNQNSFYLDEYIYVRKTKLCLRCALLKAPSVPAVTYSRKFCTTPTRIRRLQSRISSTCVRLVCTRFQNRPHHALLARGGAGWGGSHFYHRFSTFCLQQSALAWKKETRETHSRSM